MPSIRAICTDIDGTLLNSQRELSDITIQTIRKVASRIPVILASSRMPSAMRHLQEQLGIGEHPIIAYNGGYVLRYKESLPEPEVVFSTEIPLAICHQIIDLGRFTSLHFSLYQDDTWFAPHDDQWTKREARITKVLPSILSAAEVLELWSRDNRGAHKIMVMGDAVEITRLEKELSEKFLADLHVYHSKDTYLELAPKVISKASALKILLKQYYDLSPEQALAFGDNYNDIELLESVGLGIAVANARQEVKRVADEITEASIHDGVALAIRKYLSDAL